MLALLVRFLPGIASKGNRSFFVGIAPVEKLLQFLQLAIRQCIHRVDNDGLHTSTGAIAQHIIDDGDDIGKAFSRTCTGSENITCTTPCNTDRLGLMFMQAQRSTSVIILGFIFAKDSRAFTMKNALRYQFVDGLTTFK